MKPFDLLILSFAVGFGLIVMGLGWVVSQNRKSRITSVLIGTVVFTAISFFSGQKLLVGELLGLLAFLAVAGLTYAAMRGFQRLRNHPIGMGLLVAVCGLGFLIAGSVHFDRLEDESNISQLQELMTKAMETPELEKAEGVWQTDCGTRLTVFEPKNPRSPTELLTRESELLEGFQWEASVIHHKPPTDVSNCHGWVFANGQGWVMSREVPVILKDNQYRLVAKPSVGDLAIYRGEDDSYRHTTIVRAVGQVTMVEGKWGWMGVYLHEVDHSCYGTRVEYYHTDRKTHTCLRYDAPVEIGGAE